MQVCTPHQCTVNPAASAKRPLVPPLFFACSVVLSHSLFCPPSVFPPGTHAVPLLQYLPIKRSSTHPVSRLFIHSAQRYVRCVPSWHCALCCCFGCVHAPTQQIRACALLSGMSPFFATCPRLDFHNFPLTQHSGALRANPPTRDTNDLIEFILIDRDVSNIRDGGEVSFFFLWRAVPIMLSFVVHCVQECMHNTPSSAMGVDGRQTLSFVPSLTPNFEHCDEGEDFQSRHSLL